MRLYVGTNPAVPEPTGLSLLQCQLLEKLVHFLFPRNGLRTSESVVLDYLQHVWGAHEAYFRDVMKQFFVSQREVLFLWIQERRTMSSIERIIKGQPSACALDMVNRLLMMNELRILRLRWESLEVNDGNQVLSPEDLLCMTFAMMTNTEGTEDLFKDGLDMLKAGVPDFLKFKDMKIVIFSSVG
ncbi:hypothetical protein B0J11DRAFT_449429 [Dendryphion nanum]|uniref:Uncharacterized protein n=1 Tax=Dendryphion nanum TaxID=256645 RepID=A0A9P9I5T3_9PLEO|nr:hypothetical protein B0J11DRAFT_449429 [Dendryphion nanum]